MIPHFAKLADGLGVPFVGVMAALFAIGWQSSALYSRYVPLVESIPQLERRIVELEYQIEILRDASSVAHVAMLESEIKTIRPQLKQCGIALNDLYARVAM